MRFPARRSDRLGQALRCLSILAAAMLVPACATPPVAGSVSEAIAIVGATIIDPSTTAPPITGQAILIDGGVIRSIGPADELKLPPSARRIDAEGRYIIPGLWDSHVHFMNAGVSALPLLLAHGVTTVREMGGYIDSTRGWQERMRRGTLAGPRIVTPGPVLESPQYLARVVERSQRGDPRLALRVLPYRIGIGDSTDARRAIDSLRTLGVDFVKIRNSGGPAAFNATLRAAREAGLRTAAHQIAGVPIAAALDSGLTNLEHAMSPPATRRSAAEHGELLMAFARNRAWFTPTLVVGQSLTLTGDSARRAIFGPEAMRIDERRPYASDWLLEWWRMQVDERIADSSSARAALAAESLRGTATDVRQLRDLGVAILAGSDAGSVLIYPGFSLHEELELLVRDAKLTTREALESATIAPARFARLDDRLGRVAPGYIADLLILEASPLDDIRNTRRIATVIQGGRVLARTDLDALLAGARAPAARTVPGGTSPPPRR